MTSTPNSPDPEVLLNLQQQVLLQAQIVSAIKSDGLKYYRPHPKQQAFHDAHTYKRRAIFAGNRFGKSQMGCAEDCAWLRGHRPWVASTHPAYRGGIPQHAVKGLVITTDWDKVDEIWTTERGDKPGKMWRYLPPDFVKTKRRNHSGAIDMIECANGSLIRFDTVKSYMANPQGSESSDWDFIHIDEPCPEGMWKAASRGLMDRHGSAWFTLTALKEPWIRDMFTDENKSTHWSIYGSTFDNTYLTPAAIEEFKNSLTLDEQQCRIYGIPLFLSGLIYKEFNQDVHVLKTLPKGWKSELEPPSDHTIYYFIDPHPRTPHAVLFCAVSPFNQRFYYADIFVHCLISQLCDKIKEMLVGRRVGGGRIDPLAFIEDPVTGLRMVDEFYRCGVFVDKAMKDLSNGILAVKAELRPKDGDPLRTFFMPAARRTLWEINRYRWKDDGSDKPFDEDDHMMENLYRSVLTNPRWLEPTEQSNPVEDITISNAESLALDDLGDFATY